MEGFEARAREVESVYDRLDSMYRSLHGFANGLWRDALAVVEGLIVLGVWAGGVERLVVPIESEPGYYVKATRRMVWLCRGRSCTRRVLSSLLLEAAARLAGGGFAYARELAEVLGAAARLEEILPKINSSLYRAGVGCTVVAPDPAGALTPFRLERVEASFVSGLRLVLQYTRIPHYPVILERPGQTVALSIAENCYGKFMEAMAELERVHDRLRSAVEAVEPTIREYRVFLELQRSLLRS